MNSVLEYVARRIGIGPTADDAPAGTQRSADEALAALPPDLKARLGALADAPAEATELAIALFPYGYRALMVGYGLIQLEVPGELSPDEESNNPRRRVRLLEFGERIIDACADPPIPVDSVRDLDSEATKLRERYGSDLPFQVEETKL